MNSRPHEERQKRGVDIEEPSAASTQPSPLPRFSFSTSQIAPEHRFDAWSDLVGQSHDVVADPRSFEAEVVSTTMGGMIVREMSSSPQTVGRSMKRIRADHLDHVVLHLTSARFDFENRDGQRHVPAGSVTMNALSQPYRRSEAPERNAIVLSLSRSLVAEALPDPEAFHGHVLTGGAGQIFQSHMTMLARCAALIGPDQADALARATANLLAATLVTTRKRDEAARAARDEAQLLRCRRYIEQNLSSPSLSLETLCRDLGISRSAAYRLFAHQDGVATYIRKRRLAAARVVLASSSNNQRISDVAHRFGFTSVAAFSRAFRAAHGVSPSDAIGAGSGFSAAGADVFGEWIRAIVG